jgi:hypothetical protein
MAAAKFLHLKHLEIYLDGDISQGYDYLSLVSFLSASPVLETFIIGLSRYSSCRTYIVSMVIDCLSEFYSSAGRSGPNVV